MAERWLLHAHDCPVGQARLLVDVEVEGTDTVTVDGQQVAVPYGTVQAVIIEIDPEVDGRVVASLTYTRNGTERTVSRTFEPGDTVMRNVPISVAQRFRIREGAAGGDRWRVNLAWVSRDRVEGRA